jgi:hypothetical protein
VEEAELDRRVRRIMTAWIGRWGELSPEHQAKFLETAEFHELALIPEEFGRKAISKFQQRDEILREAKRLEKEQETRTRPTPPRVKKAPAKKPAAKASDKRKNTRRTKGPRLDSTPSNNDPYRSDYFGHRPRGRPTAMAEGEYSMCPGCDRRLTSDGRCNNPTCN